MYDISMATLLFIHKCIQANKKGHNIALYYWPFVRGIHQSLVESPHNGPIILTAFPWHNLFMRQPICLQLVAQCTATWAPHYRVSTPSAPSRQRKHSWRNTIITRTSTRPHGSSSYPATDGLPFDSIGSVHCLSRQWRFAQFFRPKVTYNLQFALSDQWVSARHNSIAKALELRLSCTNPSRCPWIIFF